MKKKILVVDNHPVILKYMSNLLGKEGHQVKTAEDGLSALKILMTYIPDVMFIDLVMPNINGEQLCRIIRKMPALKDTYAVVLSATIAEESRDFTELGADAFIVKGPFNQMKTYILAAIDQSDHDISMGAPKEIMGFNGVYKREITRELISAKGHLETILNNITDAILELSLEGRIIFANPAAVSIMGFSEEALLGSKFIERINEINESDRERIKEFLIRINEGSQKVDFENPVLINRRHISPSILPVREDARSSVMLVLRDITEAVHAEEILKREHEELERRVEERTIELAKANKKLQEEIHKRASAEKILKASEAKYRSLFERSRVPIMIATQNGGYLDVNPAASELFGYTKKEILKMNFRELCVDPNDEYEFQKEMKERDSVQDFEIKMRGKKDVEMDCILDVACRRDEDGSILEYHGIIRDISKMKESEEALRESEEKYRLLIENATDAIFIAQDAILKFVNPKGEAITGYSAEDLARIPFIDFIHPEDRDMVLERHLKRLEGEDLPSIYSFRILDRSGKVISVELNAVLINWKDRPATLNFLRDITAQKILEAQLQQAQKMEAIGTLAGGIAHDFNNLLMAIQGRASIALMDKNSSHRDFEHLTGIVGHVESAAELTGQLLSFARGGKYEVKPTDLNELIKKQNRMFGRTKKEITLEGKYQEDLWPVEIDRCQIERVILNLYVNAWQAMPGGGNLYLETENVTLDEDYVKNFSIEPGSYVKISITDTGVGMDKATRERIFDPFFTTKEMGRGTGLGLASVYGIIKNHGGFINVYSEKGNGATFSVYLPASHEAVNEEPKPKGDTLSGSETVLFVDDEDMIIQVAEEILERLGYTVMVVKSGKKAIEIYRENKARIDIVVLDMIMPDMNGGETYDRMKEINPGVKVLLSSGYSVSGQATEILDRGCDGFIQKPFKIKELSEKLREILDKKYDPQF